MLKLIGSMIVSALLTALIFSVTDAADDKKQPGIRMERIEIGGDAAWVIPELGSVIVDENGMTVVKMSPPADRLPKDYQSVDLRSGDQILMVNGKKVTAAKDLRMIYEKLAVGDELKIGIKRDAEMQIVSIKKADPATLPKRQMIISTDDQPGADRKLGPGMRRIKIDTDASNVTPLPDAGMVIGEKGAKVVVLGLLPEAEQLYKGDVKEGDVIVSLLDQKVTGAKQFVDVYGTSRVGDNVKLVVSRQGSETTVTFTKPEAVRRSIRHQQQ